MGRSVVCNYEVQVSAGDQPYNSRYHCMGVMSYKEALKELLEVARGLESSTGYIWPQTGIARRKLNHIPWVTNHKGIDFLEVSIETNTPDRKKYTITGKNVEDENEKYNYFMAK